MKSLYRENTIPHIICTIEEPMIKLTEEMRQLVNNALFNGTPCIIATASKDGEPNIGPKGSMMVFDDDHLAYWERTRRDHLANLEKNPKIVILFRDPSKRIVWRFHGVATLYKQGPIREQVMARVIEPEIARDPERKGYAVMISVDKVMNLAGEVLQKR